VIEAKKHGESALSSTAVTVASTDLPLAFPEFGRLGSILLSCGIPIVHMPGSLRKWLVLHAKDGGSAGPGTAPGGASVAESSGPQPGPQHVTPAFIRSWLTALGKVPTNLSRAVLTDLDSSNFDQLRGCPLVPLADGSFGVFGSNDAAAKYFFLSAADVKNLAVLLGFAAHVLVSSRQA
jgi:hypothetical protein